MSIVTSGSNLPSIYKPNPMFESIPAEHRQLPSLYLTQVKGDLINAGAPTNAFVIAYGKDDPDFQVLATRDAGDEVELYVLARSVSYVHTPDSSTWEWIDRAKFDALKAAKDRNAWVVYRYVVVIPGVNDGEPARWMLTKTGGLQTASAVNTKIDRRLKETGGADGVVAIKLKVVKKVGRVSGEDYAGLAVLPTQGTDEGFALAESALATLAIPSDETEAPASQGPSF